MRPQPVIAIFDVGKTNKKIFLFDQSYNVVYERSARFTETVDEDGDPCENIESLRLSVFDSLRCVFAKKEFEVKAINFSTYGASFVYIDENGDALSPLYNYLKPYSPELKKKFYAAYGGEKEFSSRTASPVLGNLNSGMQLYRIKYEKPELFQKIKWALHLPQYLSYLISGQAWSDLTSIGCHTNLWDFKKNGYHEWVSKEGIEALLPSITTYDKVLPATFPGSNYFVGTGLHDSSAALIPYLVNFSEPFVLISSGTWCITLNPFNNTALTQEELSKDCLCYLQYKGLPVKASRLFAGQEHEDAVKKIAAHFNLSPFFYRDVDFDPETVSHLKERNSKQKDPEFLSSDLTDFSTAKEAYHGLMMNIMEKQVASTNLVLNGSDIKRIFVDGGFSNNPLFMNLLAASYPQMEIYSASMSQATALGAALALHGSWPKKPLPNDIIHLHYYGSLLQTL
ncbi:MAG: FGGY family carbohydrate kinase [Bacteroidota bacterium]|nr:FGGY family carbohydrate kinase [Bacteroidota bacterium]